MLKYIPKRILAVLFVLAMNILLFYFGSIIFEKLILFLNSFVKNDNSIHLALNISFNSTLPTLCIVTRIYQAQINYFPILALGLYHTGFGNIRMYVINTDNRTNIQQLQQTIQFINDLVFIKDFVLYLDLGEPPRKNDFGYGMTDRAVHYLYKQYIHSPSQCQYVTFTNGDNFYSRNFMKKILPYMEIGKDMITWSYVSHHPKVQFKERIDRNKNQNPEIVDDATEKCQPAILRNGYTDLGAVAYRLGFIHKYNLTFLRTDRADPSRFDGYFVDEAVKRANYTVLIKQTLFVHQ